MVERLACPTRNLKVTSLNIGLTTALCPKVHVEFFTRLAPVDSAV